MDHTTIKISKLYEQMQNEIEEEVESLGGVVEQIDLHNRIVSIKVDPDLREHVEQLISIIIHNYSLERDKICSADPFFGIKELTGHGLN